MRCRAGAYTTTHGPRLHSFKIALADVGGAVYELFAPDTGGSVYVEHLVSKGEGLITICLLFPTRESLRARKAALPAQGCELALSGSR